MVSLADHSSSSQRVSSDIDRPLRISNAAVTLHEDLQRTSMACGWMGVWSGVMPLASECMRDLLAEAGRGVACVALCGHDVSNFATGAFVRRVRLAVKGRLEGGDEGWQKVESGVAGI